VSSSDFPVLPLLSLSPAAQVALHAPGMAALFRSSHGYPDDVCTHGDSYDPSTDVATYQRSWAEWETKNPIQASPDDKMPEGDELKRYMAIMESRLHASTVTASPQPPLEVDSEEEDLELVVHA
jgi:hypothetical protein